MTGLIGQLDCIGINVISLLLLSSLSSILTRDVFPSRRFFVRRRSLSFDGLLPTDDSMMLGVLEEVVTWFHIHWGGFMTHWRKNFANYHILHENFELLDVCVHVISNLCFHT